MPLDATAGGASSNSYVTVIEADAYFATRIGGEAWDEVDDADAALITATSELERLRYLGSKSTSTQALKFPRSGISDDEGTAYDDDIIPLSVKQATYELALYLAQNPESLESGGDLSEFKSLKIGELGIEPSLSQMSTGSFPSRVLKLLASLRITQARVIRA